MLLAKVKNNQILSTEEEESFKLINCAPDKPEDLKIPQVLILLTRLKEKEYSYAHDHILVKGFLNNCDAKNIGRICKKDPNQNEEGWGCRICNFDLCRSCMKYGKYLDVVTRL